MLSKCADIPSLAFIGKLQKLEFLSFVGTKILDGDLSFCERLEYTGFDNKKNYSHTMDEMKLINAKNRKQAH